MAAIVGALERRRGTEQTGLRHRFSKKKGTRKRVPTLIYYNTRANDGAKKEGREVRFGGWKGVVPHQQHLAYLAVERREARHVRHLLPTWPWGDARWLAHPTVLLILSHLLCLVRSQPHKISSSPRSSPSAPENQWPILVTLVMMYFLFSLLMGVSSGTRLVIVRP